jgi:hypothetical protein
MMAITTNIRQNSVARQLEGNTLKREVQKLVGDVEEVDPCDVFPQPQPKCTSRRYQKQYFGTRRRKVQILQVKLFQ